MPSKSRTINENIIAPINTFSNKEQASPIKKGKGMKANSGERGAGNLTVYPDSAELGVNIEF